MCKKPCSCCLALIQQTPPDNDDNNDDTIIVKMPFWSVPDKPTIVVL